jgi:very-short-patch-repair endonuclease
VRTPKPTLQRARRLRTCQTRAEQKLWGRLRRNQIGGLKFKRQHPIAGFIADFCCLDRRLVIELDGGQHNEDANAAKDADRTKAMQRMGFRVLRFWNNEVLQNLDGVLAEIGDALKVPSP